MAQTTLIPTASPAAPIIAASVLDNLAARLRPNGVCLVMLRADGTVAWHDANASLFFQRFALPMLQYPDANCGLRENVQSLTAASAISVWNLLPGIVVGAFPYVEKRQVAGVLILCAKSAAFRLGEDVLRVC